MNKFHKEILDAIKKTSKKKTAYKDDNKYVGSSDLIYSISVPKEREIAKEFAKNHKNITQEEFKELLLSLSKGKSHEEKSMPGKLLTYLPNLRETYDVRNLDIILNNISGWAQIDSLCYGIFTSDEMIADWNKWLKLLESWCVSTNLNKQRASLVFLCYPNSKSEDKRFLDLGFKFVKELSSEKSILITKAISWILRSMIDQHKKEVSDFVEANIDSLPKIAIRETKTKLKYGIKNYRGKRE